MSVIVELTIPNRGFVLGRTIGDVSGMRYELERIVPTTDSTVPFLWAHGEDTGALEEKFRESTEVSEYAVLDRLGEWSLYRIDWVTEYDGLLDAFGDLDVTMLEARGDGTWYFRLRFPDHDRVSRFDEYVREHEIPVHVERVYTMTEADVEVHRFDLTVEQREALVMALERGYFETPSEVTLEELAGGLDITPQALSDRIRRGTRKVLAQMLLSAADDQRAPTER